MTKIKTARTTEGEKFYYLGHTQAVVNDAGDSIEDLLAEQDEKIELLNDNTGVSDYPEFETSKTYKTGTIVKYEGVLYKFTADHAAGIWDSGEVKAWNINAETQEKLSELGSEVNNKLSTWDSLQNVGEYGYSSEQKKITIRISDDNIQFVPESFYGSLWVYNNSRYIYTANGLLDLDTTGIHNLLSEYDSLIYNIQKTVKGTSDLIIEHPIKKGYQYNLDIAVTNLGYITIYYLGESGNKGSEISSILYDSNSLKSNNIIANVDCFGFYIQNANSTHVTVTLNSEGTVLQDIEAIKSGLEVYTEKFSGDITLTDVLYNQNYIQSNEGIDGQDGIKIILENDGTDKKLTGWVAGGTGNKLQSFGSLLPSTLKANEKISIEFVLGTSEKIYQIWIQALDTNSQGHVYVSVLSKENRLNAIENRLKSVESISSRTTIYVGETRDYKKFTDGLKVAVEKGDVDLYVDEGDYDVIEELGEDAILKNLQAGYYGPTLGNNVNIHFAHGAKIIANYSGSEKLIMTNFSPINSLKSTTKYRNNYKIFGGEFECSRVRYCVHNECEGKGTYTHEYHDCIMKLDNTNNEYWKSPQCIGGGLGEYSTIIIDGGVYDSVGATGINPNTGLADDTYKQCISYHQPTYTNEQGDYIYNTFKNYVSIKNVYLKHGTCLVSLGGGSAELSTFEISNCSMTFEPWLNGEGVSGITQNFKMFSWNNEVR